MKTFLFLMIIFCSICPIELSGFFNIQHTQTILCHEFPLISTIDDSSLQCARLRFNANVPSVNFNLQNPSQITLLIIVNQSSSSSTMSPVNLIINFTQSLDFPSSVNEIRVGLLVSPSHFTVNNQTVLFYSSNDIPILYWKNSKPNTYDLIDLLHLDNHEYKTDLSMCEWTDSRWNRLFNSNSSSTSSYVYILKTNNTHLLFTLTDAKNRSLPLPYLNILYCIPYQLGITELVLILCFSIVCMLFLISFSILHNRKGEYNLLQYFKSKYTRQR